METTFTMSLNQIEKELNRFDWVVAQPYEGGDYQMLKFLESLDLIEISYRTTDGAPYVKKNPHHTEIIRTYRVRRAVEKMVIAGV
jgi:hypothetical protein